jgi:hypothetical protein
MNKRLSKDWQLLAGKVAEKGGEKIFSCFYWHIQE